MTLKKRGLTLGKFAPLHKGHQLLIETALSEMDEVVLIIYDCPETPVAPLNVRSRWISRIYPTVEVIEAWDGPLEVGDTPEIKQRHEDYVINRLGVRGITHFYSSEFYGEHMSLALGAINRIVDRDRTQLPLSGTEIRKNPYAFRESLHPEVYRDLIINVVFLGAPSTGKTTLAARLAEKYATRWMPEYGREYWEEHQVNRRVSVEQLVEIARGHLEREEALLGEANRYLFTDTNALTTYIFSLYYHGAAAPPLVHLADRAASRYDLVFVCDTDIAYDTTWDRSGEANRLIMQKMIVADLQVRKIPFFLLRGELETRISYVERVLSQYRKYENVLTHFAPRSA
jgi:HTH-type transcriptional regulator, transcriptional repressor of NAD biosynthesis genes